MLHRGLERVRAAQLRVDDNQTNGPVDHDCEANEEGGACNKAGVADGVGLADDASATKNVSAL